MSRIGWAAVAGVAFAALLVVGVGPFQPEASAILAAAALVYIGAAAIGSKVSAWWWFIATGGPIGLDHVTDGRVDATTVLLGVAAGLTVLGLWRLARDERTAAGLVPTQVLAIVGFGLLAGSGAALASCANHVVGAAGATDAARWGAVVVAAGLLLHAYWDWRHHRSGLVVPRSYAMFCLTLDTTLAVGVVLTTW